MTEVRSTTCYTRITLARTAPQNFADKHGVKGFLQSWLPNHSKTLNSHRV